MWWLVIAPIVGLGKLIYDVAAESNEVKAPAIKTPLVRNFDSLRRKTEVPHTDRIAIMGQPGSGKSSIINRLSKGRVLPKPTIGTHTDATDCRPDSCPS